jgi:hypothetical protein
MEIVKRGSVFTSKEPINLIISGVISEPFYTKNNKKYIHVALSREVTTKIYDIHEIFKKYMNKKNVQDSLGGNILKIKVPFLKNRVMCKTNGDKIIQEHEKGDEFNGVITYCGVWAIGDFCGPSWKLESVE